MIRKIITSIILLMVLLYIAFITIERKFYNDFVLQKIQRLALNQGLGLSIGTLDWAGWNLKAEKIIIKLPTKLAFPIILELDQCSLLIEPYSLLTGKLSLASRISAYAGEINTNLNYNIFTSSMKINASAKDLAIAKQQQLASLDITSGVLNLAVNDLLITSQIAQSGNVSINLSNVNKSEITKLPSYLTKLPLEVSVPIIKDLNSTSALSLQNKQLEIRKLELSSNFGSFSTNGTMQFSDNQNIKSVAVNLDGKLTEQGKGELGSYLMLLSQGQLNSSTSNFKAKILAYPFRFLVQ